MTIKIYNSLSRQKEEFKPVEDGKVKMYVCGMTVYSDAHIGHARTYFAFDVISRYFKYKGYDVTYVQNVTDVDDKIINAANKDGADPLEYSNKFTERCLGDLDNLGIKRADIYPKASQTIQDMIEMIQEIIDKGYGYVADGDVYFSVEKFKDYGKLSGQRLDALMSGVRIDPGDKKHNPFDFALWKKAKPDEPSWDSPWGKGRPGWHIECSTMSSKFLGLPFDIHGGGMDLRFPHHENEIAQAEAATGKNFANYWMHIGLLTVDGEKMSKSIGNIINVKDLIKEWDPEVVRFFFAQAHYRSPPDFSDKALENAKKGLDRIYRLKEKLERLSNNKPVETINKENLNEADKSILKIIDEFINDFNSAMDDDFNSPLAVSVVFEFVNKMNKAIEENKSENTEIFGYALFVLLKIGDVLTILQEKKSEATIIDEEVMQQLKEISSKYKTDVKGKDFEQLINSLLQARDIARKNKDWDTADGIRNDLDKIGFEIQDTSKGPVWRKK